jgi:hypothetical protein
MSLAFPATQALALPRARGVVDAGMKDTAVVPVLVLPDGLLLFQDGKA